MTPLGTPLSPHAAKVMLLGVGELGKEVLLALQRLGVETVGGASRSGLAKCPRARTV